MRPPDDGPWADQVDWELRERSRTRLTAERAIVGSGLLVVLGTAWYDSVRGGVFLIGRWNPAPIDWVFLMGLVLLVGVLGPPIVRNSDRVRAIAGTLLSRPLTAIAVTYLGAFVVIGLLGPYVFPRPSIQFQYAYNPPLGFATDVTPRACLGAVTGESVFDQYCHGSLSAVLGTNHRGIPLSVLLVTGARTALYVVVITAAFIVPAASLVGLIAGLRGGIVDDILMGYVDLQLTLPAIVVYFFGFAYWNSSILLLLGAFGLLSWGGVARLVRSEVLQRREAGYVRVARGYGTPWRTIARRHIMPNVSNSLVPAAFQLLALLVLVEAGVAFIGFHDISVYSWGSTMSESLNAAIQGKQQVRAERPAYRIWWVSTFPALALTMTIFSLKILGDGLRDALNPREGRS